MIKSMQKDDQKRTAKQWVSEMLYYDADCVFDYYYERHAHVYDLMTEKEQEEVRKHLNKFLDRFNNMLIKAYPEVGK